MEKPTKEAKEMKLRCLIKETDKGYVGICLELSLAVREKTPAECRGKLEWLISDYIDTLFMLKDQHKNVVVRSVEFYLFKKILFDISYCLHNLRRKDDYRAFVKKTVVPVAA